MKTCAVMGLEVVIMKRTLQELRATRRKTCPFRTMPDLRDDFRELPRVPPVWVRPTVVVEVEYRQRLKGGLRHAALKGIRPDKKPRLLLSEGSQAKDRLAPPKDPAFPGSDGSKGKGHPTLLRMPPNSRRSRRDC
jgi:ATP-dependent DNA ligase